jgi:hypothetical protein
MAPKKKVPKKKKSPTRAGKAIVKKSKKTSPKKATKKPSGKKTARRPSGKADEILVIRRRPGSGSAGQSGDIQGLSKSESVDTESVEELEEEGQSFEAAFVDGVENALDPDEAEVTTSEVPEDDVPSEYLENE